MKNVCLKVLSICIFIIGLLCVGYSIQQIATENSLKKSIQNEITSFENNQRSLINQSISSDLSSEITSEEAKVIEKDTKKTLKPMAKTVAVLEIPSISLKAPVTMGLEEWQLKTHAGLYPSLGYPDQGSVIAIAAHSSWTTRCAHCFFEELEELVVGDTIILSYSQEEYVYSITEVSSFDYPDETRYFSENEDPSIQKIVLVTCTNGDNTVRTFVTANRIG